MNPAGYWIMPTGFRKVSYSKPTLLMRLWRWIMHGERWVNYDEEEF